MGRVINIILWEMITIEKIDGRIAVRFSYNKDYIEKVKNINGYRWHSGEKYPEFSM